MATATKSRRGKAESPKIPPQSYRELELKEIRTSPHNPRKYFNDASLTELANDIREHDVVEPIVVRPVTTRGKLTYEIVAGERRFRASKIAGKKTIPAIVRELSDQVADEIRIIENLQREDLTALEEAEGFEYLRRKYDLTAEQIAEKVNKSRRTVYDRLQLVRLGERARKLMLEGKLNSALANLVSTIPDHHNQEAFLKQITYYNGELAPFQRAREVLNTQFQVSLSKAQFKTTAEDLLPGVPSCKACPYNTSNSAGEQRTASNVCTDLACFAKKQAAHFDRVAAEAVAAGGGAIAPGTAGVFYANSAGLTPESGFVDLDELVRFGNDTKPLRKVLGKNAPPQWVALDGRSRIRFLIKREDAQAALKVARANAPKTAPVPPSPREAELKTEKQKEREAARVRSAVTTAAIAQMVETASSGVPLLEEQALRAAAKELIDDQWAEVVARVLRRRGVAEPAGKDARAWERRQKARESFAKAIDGYDRSQLIGLLFELVITRAGLVNSWESDHKPKFKTVCAEFGVDLQALTRQAREEARAKTEKPKAGSAPDAAGRSKKVVDKDETPAGRKAKRLARHLAKIDPDTGAGAAEASSSTGTDVQRGVAGRAVSCGKCGRQIEIVNDQTPTTDEPLCEGCGGPNAGPPPPDGPRSRAKTAGSTPLAVVAAASRGVADPDSGAGRHESNAGGAGEAPPPPPASPGAGACGACGVADRSECPYLLDDEHVPERCLWSDDERLARPRTGTAQHGQAADPASSGPAAARRAEPGTLPDLTSRCEARSLARLEPQDFVELEKIAAWRSRLSAGGAPESLSVTDWAEFEISDSEGRIFRVVSHGGPSRGVPGQLFIEYHGPAGVLSSDGYRGHYVWKGSTKARNPVELAIEQLPEAVERAAADRSRPARRAAAPRKMRVAARRRAAA